jgi:hypothetical protein
VSPNPAERNRALDTGTELLATAASRQKRRRNSSPLVICNGGLHFHALLLVPPATRLGQSVEQHFRANEDTYLGRLKLIQSLDVRPVTDFSRASRRLRVQDGPKGARLVRRGDPAPAEGASETHVSLVAWFEAIGPRRGSNDQERDGNAVGI